MTAKLARNDQKMTAIGLLHPREMGDAVAEGYPQAPRADS
jgi:hypothetical protein